MSLSAEVWTLRSALGLRRRELAPLLHMTPRDVRRWERHRDFVPSAVSRQALAQLMLRTGIPGTPWTAFFFAPEMHAPFFNRTH